MGLVLVPFIGHCFEAAGDFFELADGRAAGSAEHGVLAGVFGDGGDQHGDDRGEGLGEGGGLLRMCHS
jgi:hypothetical protein